MELKYRSDEIGQIAAAMAKAQGAYKPLIANENGPRGMYANLTATLDAVRDALSVNAVFFTQEEVLLDEGLGALLLKTELMHESGQWVASWARIISGETLRDTGINIEVVARRAAQKLLGIAPSKNDPASWDDDGASMAEKHLMREVRKPLEDQKIVNRNDVIDKRQYDELLLELEGYPKVAQDIMDKHQISTLADLPNSEYHRALVKIREIKVTDSGSFRRR